MAQTEASAGAPSDLADVDWIPAGTRFGVDEMVFFAGRGEQSLDDTLARIDVIVTGPHASAALPAEMSPFVDSRFTRRLQYDFTDVSTSPVARRWAQLDPHVLYIEDPHPRAVRDANRPRPDDLIPGLREAFERLEAAGPEARPSLAGVDAVRPVTFGYLPVLRKPESAEGWERLGAALAVAGSLGIDAYERVRDDLIERVVEAKLRHLAGLDPGAVSAADWHSATHLDVLSIHDTMNHTARPDGAICLERAPADRLPDVVSLSNRGDADGELRAMESVIRRDPADVPTMRPARLRAIATAYRVAFDAWAQGDVAFNRPYLGGHETMTTGPKLRAIEPMAVIRAGREPPRQLRLGAWQNEFLREFLLGPEATAALIEPGRNWIGPPPSRVDWLADRLRHAHDLVRRWDKRAGRGRRAELTVAGETAWSAPEGRRVHLVGRGSTWVREVDGPPGAPTVILLHGLGATATLNWPGAFDVLSRRYRVLALDHRGHGRGMRTRRPFRLVDSADDVVALADALEIDQLVPVGYSMGGPVAMLACHRHPHRVPGLVLCATAAVFRREEPRPANAVYAAALATSLRFTPPIVRRKVTATLVDVARRRGTLPHAVAHETRHHDPAAIVEAARAVAGFDGRHWIGTLDCPAAVVVTTRDTLVPAHRQLELAELLHAPKFAVEGGHDACARHPGRFLSAVDGACASVIGRVARR